MGLGKDRSLLRTLLSGRRTAAGSGVKGKGAAGADTAAGVRLFLTPGVPGEAEQPTPELVEVEVGNTALLRCGPSPSLGNLSHVDWFSVSS